MSDADSTVERRIARADGRLITTAVSDNYLTHVIG